MMRKVISIFLFMAFILLPLQIVAAGDEQHQSEIQQSTEESIVETAEGLNNLEGNAKSSDFFWSTFLRLEKTSNGQLIITGYTEGTSEVTKCGFTYIKLQRLVNGKWTDYTEYCYYDLYSNSSTKYFKVYVSPPNGYSYKAICEHYAEKPLLGILKSKQKMPNTTTTINL
jgi:hypothetical protein